MASGRPPRSAYTSIDLTDSPPREQPLSSAPNNNTAVMRAAGATRPRDDDVVVVATQPAGARPKRRRTEGSSTAVEGGDEVVCTDIIGEVPLRDLPHARADCVQHRLAEGNSISNAAHCSQCYCYVCDVKANECTMWGTGTSSNDHCNAHKSAQWSWLRSLARSGKMAEVRKVYSSTVPTAPAPPETVDLSQPGAMVKLPLVNTLRKPGSKTPTKNKLGPRLPGPSAAAPQTAQPAGKLKLPAGMVAMPDPALDPNVMELGSFTFHVETAKEDTTIAQLAARLVRHGYYMRKAPPQGLDYSSGASMYGDTICLQNIFELSNPLSYRMGINDTYKHLKLLDDPAVDDGPPLSEQRVRQVTVVDSVGRVPAVVLGVTTVKDAKPEAITAAIQAQLQPPFDPAIEKLLLTETYSASGYYMPSDNMPRLIADNVDMNDRFYNAHQLYLYRIPKLTEPESGPSKPLPPPPFGGARSPPPSYVAFMLRQRITRPVPGLSRSLGAYDRMFMSMTGLEGMGCIGHNYYDSGDDEDEDDHGSDDYCEDCGCYHHSGPRDEVVTELKKHGLPILLPVAEKHIHSGSEANAALSKALEQALRPYFSPGAAANPAQQEAGSSRSRPSPAPGTVSFKLLRGQSYFGYDASSAMHFDIPGRVLETTTGGIAHMTAMWEADAMAGYDFAPLAKPVVDASATKEALAETEELVQEEQKREDARRQRSNLRWDLIEELKAGSMRYQITEKEKHLPGHSVAMVSVTLDLVPKPGGTPRQGLLTFTVYAFAKDGPGYRTLFQSWDDWSTATRLQDHFPLRKTMKLLLQDEPDAENMWNQLDEMTKAAQTSNDIRSVNGLLRFLQTPERQAAQQPPGLIVQMRSYQLQSLQFMLDAEARNGGYRSVFWLRKVNRQGRTFWYSPVLARASLQVPEQAAGGFLAEEMGLGKTVEVLALILAAPPPPHVVSGMSYTADPTSPTSPKRITSRATLVVCAVSLVGQWVEEAQSKTAGSLRILQYHGQNRMRDVNKIANNYDLVVTTYQTLTSDYTRDGKRDIFAPLGQIHWFRIVFDEGHMVKTVATQQSKVCVVLSSERRWCCTGTPIGTEIGDLLGQFAVINMAPMSLKMFFDAHIKPVFGTSHRSFGSEVSPATLLYTLKQTMVRHTKTQVLDGEVVLQLPPKTQEDLAVTLTADEQALYKEVFAKVQEKWKAFRAAGAATVTKYQLTIMSMLGPLRRICSGGRLKQTDIAVPDLEPDSLCKSAAATLASMTPDATLVSPESECSICLDLMEAPVVTPCQHWFCRECITSWLDTKDTCTLCRGKLSVASLRSGVMPGYKPPAPVDPDAEAGPSEPAIYQCESKLRALLSELRAMRDADSTAKALVFSQYNTTLDWLKQRLTEEGFGYRTISGSMPLKQRTKAIEQFQKDPPTTVFLLSMRSGAVGINLTAASHVFIMEPCLNPALEEQAVGRSWRMGQKRSVIVKRFYVKGSVEESVIDVVKARREAGARQAGASGSGDAAAEAAVNAAAQALLDEQLLSGAGRRRGGLQRAIADVVAGNIRSDKQMLKMNELEMLFAAPSFTTTAEQEAEAAAATPAAAAPLVAAPDGLVEEAAPCILHPTAGATATASPPSQHMHQSSNPGSRSAAPAPEQAGTPAAGAGTADASAANSSGDAMDVDWPAPAAPSTAQAGAQTGREAAPAVLAGLAEAAGLAAASASAAPAATASAAPAAAGPPERSRRNRKVWNYADMLKDGDE